MGGTTSRSGPVAAPTSGVHVTVTCARNYDYSGTPFTTYDVVLRYQGFEWTVSKRWSEVLSLHSAVSHIVEARGIKRPRKTWRRSVAANLVNKRIADLQQYLSAVLGMREAWELPATKEFAEVGALAFELHMGRKGKEGWLAVRAGGYKHLPNSTWRARRREWVVCKDMFIAAFANPQDPRPRKVMIVDGELAFHVMDKRTFEIVNNSRRLQCVAANYRQTCEWLDALRLQYGAHPRVSLTMQPPLKSFAPVREHAEAAWYVDAEAGFAAIAQAIFDATEQIFISGWWISPAVELVRARGIASEQHVSVTLADLLWRKANEGVQVYVELYKEVAVTGMRLMDNESLAAKNVLSGLHENVHVLRHPNHIGFSGVTQLYWSHHDKVVVVDQRVAFIGGLDLCYGRFDGPAHSVVDPVALETLALGDTSNDFALWPGPDYRNPRLGSGVPTTAVQSAMDSADKFARRSTAQVNALVGHVASFSNAAAASAASVGGARVGARPSAAASASPLLPAGASVGGGSGTPGARSATPPVPPVRGSVAAGGASAPAAGAGAGDGPGESAPHEDDMVAEAVPTADSAAGVAPGAAGGSVSASASFGAAGAVVGFAAPGDRMDAAQSSAVSRPSVVAPGTALVDSGSESDGGGDGGGEGRAGFAAVGPGRGSMAGMEGSVASGGEETEHDLDGVVAPKGRAGSDDEAEAARLASTASASTAAEPARRPKAGAHPHHDPRLPWHDIHLRVTGPAAVDVAVHFIQRWNHHRVSKDERNQPMLVPKSDMSGWWAVPPPSHAEHPPGAPSAPPAGAGPSAPSAPPAGEDDDTDASDEGRGVAATSAALLPAGGAGAGLGAVATATGAMHRADTIRAWNWSTDGTGSVIDRALRGNSRVVSPCNVHVVRSLSPWSAGVDVESSVLAAHLYFIHHSSHFIYAEQQFFVSRMGNDGPENAIGQAITQRLERAIAAGETFRLIMLLPVHPEGDPEADVSVQGVMYYQYSTISRGAGSILNTLARKYPQVDPFDYVSFYSLRSHGAIRDTPVTEQIYVHSKLVIVDDRVVLIGSANMNDRSMAGDRDSEIAAVITNGGAVPSRMNGKPWTAGGFAHSLRKRLWSEHLGLGGHGYGGDATAAATAAGFDLDDPVCDATYFGAWMLPALRNTRWYETHFPETAKFTCLERTAPGRMFRPVRAGPVAGAGADLRAASMPVLGPSAAAAQAHAHALAMQGAGGIPGPGAARTMSLPPVPGPAVAAGVHVHAPGSGAASPAYPLPHASAHPTTPVPGPSPSAPPAVPGASALTAGAGAGAGAGVGDDGAGSGGEDGGGEEPGAAADGGSGGAAAWLSDWPRAVAETVAGDGGPEAPAGHLVWWSLGFRLDRPESLKAGYGAAWALGHILQ